MNRDVYNGERKIVLAYSGGLDTSVAIQWLVESGYEVIACCLDVGEGKIWILLKKSHYCWSK